MFKRNLHNDVFAKNYGLWRVSETSNIDGGKVNELNTKVPKPYDSLFAFKTIITQKKNKIRIKTDFI